MAQETQAAPSEEPPATIQYEAPSSSPGKKTTRQWAAWTHEEEANFFIALRQVGKNFDKITSRVQSKNKDQVRHYYYRIIKRMNKLLGPAFVLDAKNTKDANAALLRWWSLLEKYSCSASKLHLKPRRFKTFVTALAHALLKDQKKTKRKQSLQDNATPATGEIPAGASKAVVNDPESAKMLDFEAQNLQKIGSGKGTTVKRNGGQSTNRCKGENSKVKPCQRRRKASDGPVSSAAFKRWEKAANAGVTLVAEAAEQLERAALAKQKPSDQAVLHSPPNEQAVPSLAEGTCLPKKRNGQVQANALKASVLQGATPQQLSQPFQNSDSFKAPMDCYNSELSGRADSAAKLKLQLFPIDEFTRKALEKDGHNPYLELTLKARKMISSVLQHLMQKWGSSSVATGELMLFPYNAQWKDLLNCQNWTLKDTAACAGDVYAALGSPTIFRLRYGWFSSRVLQISNGEPCQHPAFSVSHPIDMTHKSTQCESNRIGKLRKLDVSRSEAMADWTNEENISGSFGYGYSLKARQNGNMHNGSDIELPFAHVSNQTSRVYSDYVPSITLPLESVQSTAQMSTVTSVKDPAMSIRHPLSFPHSVKGSGDAEVGHCNRFSPRSVEEVEDKCKLSDQGNTNLSDPILHDVVPAKACRVPEFTSQIRGSAWQNEECNGGFVERLMGNEETQKFNNRSGLSTMDWVDSLSNISIGDLLNEASCAEHGNSYEGLSIGSGTQHQLFPQYMDSFDAAINAHIVRSQEVTNMPINHSQPSIWDGDETCDAFAFRKIPFSTQELGTVDDMVTRLSSQEVPRNSCGLSGSSERFAQGNSIPEEDLKAGSCAREQSHDDIGERESTANDLFWTDSLGSLDISARPSGVQGVDFLAGDNSISFSGLVAISLDAFQNCSIFGSEKKFSMSVNDQDQQVQSLCPTNRSENDSVFVFDSKNMENSKSVSLDVNPNFQASIVDLHGAENQLTASIDGVPV
ncbi:hypothetical protein SUGI_0294110 [Cryptomeria japonica]|nr:hypothetical protein SUGI_0294110 [Cryptomeria japonica]